MSGNEETRISDAGGGLFARTGHLEDIAQFLVEPKPVSPVPEVREVEVKMRIFDDAERVLKVVRTTRFKFEEYQIFGAAYPQRQVQKVQGASPGQDRFFVGIRRKQEVKWNAGEGRMAQAKDSLSGHRIVFQPSPVGLKSLCDQRIGYGCAGRFRREHQEINVLSRTDRAPGIDGQCANQTIGKGRLRQRLNDSSQVPGQRALLNGWHRRFLDQHRRTFWEPSVGTGCRGEDGEVKGESSGPARRPATIRGQSRKGGSTAGCPPPAKAHIDRESVALRSHGVCAAK